MRPHTNSRGRLKVYLATAFLARLADEGMAVAVALLAMHRTGSAALGAFVLTAWMAPHVLSAPLAGGLVGRVARPRVFYCGALGVFAASIALLALLVGRAPTPVTLLVAAAGGSCGPIVTGGLSSLLATLTDPGADRRRGYALDAATYNAASVTGAGVVSLVAGFASPVVATALLAGGAGCAALLAAALPHPRPQPPTGASEQQTLRADLLAGLAALWRIPELRAITLGTSVAFAGIGGLAVTAVLLAEERGHPGGGGILMAAFAVGGLAGALALARWLPRVSAQHLAGYGLLGTGVAMGAAALVPSYPLCAVLFAVAGLCDGPLLSATLRIRADHAPTAVRTQIFTLGAGLKITAAACGAALTGVAAGLPAWRLLTAIAALQLVAALLYVVVRRRGRVPTGEVPSPRIRTGV